MLNNRLQLYCQKYNLIDKKQIGFKKNHRTSDHLLTLKAIVKKNETIGKKKLFTCFVDFKKAYDSLWHEGLFYKVNKVGISGDFLGLLKNIYATPKLCMQLKVAIQLLMSLNLQKVSGNGALLALFCSIYMSMIYLIV